MRFFAGIFLFPCGTPPLRKRNKRENPEEGWEDGTPPPHRDFKERGVVR